MSKKPRTATPREDEPTPYLDLRIGGLRVTLRRAPYRVLLLVGAAASAGVSAWLSR
ncbi:hypothetical protein [Streptomyces sp. NPDC058308]|uniref:hypothetical protein n=1 Tax=Streptomyces sp. NPDC058308 TaxID=3346440 RepID=UPI0036E775D9